MHSSETQKDLVFHSWYKLAGFLQNSADIRYFFTGGLAVRMLKAQHEGLELTAHALREHGDIDIIVFEEDIIDFLSLFPKEEYTIWHAAYIGAQQQSAHEHHHVSLKDKETGISIGTFIARDNGNGRRYVGTNKYEHVHPNTVFEGEIIEVNGFQLKAVVPEWPYYKYLFYDGIKKRDTDILFPMINFERFHRIQAVSAVLPINLLEYHLWLIEKDRLYKDKGVLSEEG